ncbi:MAG: dihydrolipoyl dehydrogenase, partial [Alicyclobacillus sp.]|nr:dihydrolipoyl dehydrogenase [Alicyclobacillus sp.]
VIAGRAAAVDYRCIPAVVFCDPEIASVGLTEDEAKQQYGEIAVGRFPYAANGRAVALGADAGFVRLIADKESGLLAGAQVIGAEASDLIAELGLAIEMGATLEDVALTIHAHPTLGEMVMEAAEVALGSPVHVVSR